MKKSKSSESKPIKIPTSDELVILNDVAAKVARKYKFGLYSFEDIRQECLVFGMEALFSYNPKKGPLANFMYVHMSRRTLNLKRNVTRKEIRAAQESDDYPLDAEAGETQCEESHVREIVEQLPMEVRNDFMRMMSGVSIAKSRKDKVKQHILELFPEYEVEYL